MDTTITSGEVDTSTGTAETATPDSSSGTGNAAPENTSEQDGGSKDTAEGSQQQAGGRRKWSIQDEVKELRAQRRELRERLSGVDDMRQELAQLRESLNRQSKPGTEKTQENFWQNPEARFQELKDEIAKQREGLVEAFHQTREQEYAQQELRREQASAAEFIRTQKGYDPSDDEDLIEIIDGIPNKQSLSPSWVAEYAWMKLQQSRGVGDRTLAKQRASGVQGQPPGAGFGEKRWSKAEFDAALDRVEKAPHDPKNAELIRELEAAHKEGRVK